MKQLSHEDYSPNKHDKSLTIICSTLQSPINLGSICRLAEAFGVETMYISKENETFLDKPKFLRTARQTHHRVKIKIYDDIDALIRQLKKQGYLTIALEYCDNSVPLNKIYFHKRTAFWVGHENTGIDQSVLTIVDQVGHINMFGSNSSMNVAQAAGIALYHCVNFEG